MKCSECGRAIGRFDEKHPPVCPHGRVPRVAEPTVLSQHSSEAALLRGPTGASPTFQGDTDLD